jgi:hypothetical protein
VSERLHEVLQAVYRKVIDARRASAATPGGKLAAQGVGALQTLKRGANTDNQPPLLSRRQNGMCLGR